MHLLICTSYLFKLFIYNLPIYISSVKKFKFIQYNMHVEKNSLKLTTICWFIIMFITNMLSMKITLWGGGAMVKDLTPQYESEKFKSSH
jgi:hypothetical protein